ncbi:hypothetical protein CPC08DRAFT_764085 [Agrocybe pediades]|nr:hypothetical protein CPC08DRAFT_764085 [Agrocybe pediades]
MRSMPRATEKYVWVHLQKPALPDFPSISIRNSYIKKPLYFPTTNIINTFSLSTSGGCSVTPNSSSHLSIRIRNEKILPSFVPHTHTYPHVSHKEHYYSLIFITPRLLSKLAGPDIGMKSWTETLTNFYDPLRTFTTLYELLRPFTTLYEHLRPLTTFYDLSRNFTNIYDPVTTCTKFYSL